MIVSLQSIEICLVRIILKKQAALAACFYLFFIFYNPAINFLILLLQFMWGEKFIKNNKNAHTYAKKNRYTTKENRVAILFCDIFA